MAEGSEQQIIRELKDGSQAALGHVYDLYAARLTAFCLHFTKTTEDTEEIVEDVFISIWNSRAFIRQEETLNGLIFRMARNRLINVFRQRVNSPDFADFVDYNNLSVSGEDDVERHLEFDDFMRDVNKALDELPQTQRDVVRHSKIEGMNNKEIANTMGLSEQTVKNSLSLGLKALRKRLWPGYTFLMLFFVI